jgi:hypothetical protein
VIRVLALACSADYGSSKSEAFCRGFGNCVHSQQIQGCSKDMSSPYKISFRAGHLLLVLLAIIGDSRHLLQQKGLLLFITKEKLRLVVYSYYFMEGEWVFIPSGCLLRSFHLLFFFRKWKSVLKIR